MIIVMEMGATSNEIRNVEDAVVEKGLVPKTISGQEKTVVLVMSKIYSGVEDLAQHFLSYPSVETILPVSNLHREVRKSRPSPELKPVRIGNVFIGCERPKVIAGPCAVETREQALLSVQAVVSAGVDILRLMIFKPRTEKRSWQGIGAELGVPILIEMRERFGVPIISEPVRIREIDVLYPHVDGFQVGTRNATNYDLLEHLAQTKKPVLLKRGMGQKIEELFGSATYLMDGPQTENRIVLSERGIRSFESASRFTPDLFAIPYIRRESGCPVIFDPSHATGLRWAVPPLALAAVAAGADGIEIDVHPYPQRALIDAAQQLTPDAFQAFMDKLRVLGEMRCSTSERLSTP